MEGSEASCERGGLSDMNDMSDMLVKMRRDKLTLARSGAGRLADKTYDVLRCLVNCILQRSQSWKRRGFVALLSHLSMVAAGQVTPEMDTPLILKFEN